MKKTNMQHNGRPLGLREFLRRALVVLLTISMVSTNSPISYVAEAVAMSQDESATTEPAQTQGVQPSETQAEVEAEDTESAADESSQTDTMGQPDATDSSGTQVEVVDTISDANQGQTDVKLSFTHAYIHYNGQSIGLPTTSVSVPTGEEFRFVAVADEGFVLKQVQTMRDGAEAVLEADEDGTFVVPAADVAEGLTVSVEAEADPFSTNPTTKPIEEKRNEEPTFEYEDEDVKVIATLTDPAALPADVTFKVTLITRDSKDDQGNPVYNYDAYMEALNKSVGETDRYTEDNTLLYDTGFFTAKKDESGKAIEDEQVEVQLEDGQVTLEFQFKKNQLSDGIKATDSSNIEIVHLPLKDSVRSTVDSTAAASDISADDVIVQIPRDQSANVEAEQIQMSLSNLSVSGITDNETPAPTTQEQEASNPSEQEQPVQDDAGTSDEGTQENQGNSGTSDADTTQSDNSSYFNLNDLLTDVYIGARKNENNQYVLLPGESYEILLSFAETYNSQFPNDGSEMKYELPDGLTDATTGHGGVFSIWINDCGTWYEVTGNEYRIVDGILYVKFNKNAGNFNKLTAAANVQFSLSFEGTVDQNVATLLFSDSISKNIYVDTSHSLTVSKSASANTNSKEVNYTVTVSSHGKNTDVRVEDIITSENDLLTFDTVQDENGSLVLDPNKYEIRSNMTNHDVSGLVPVIDSENNGKFTLTIDKMSDGEVITIIYKATIHPEKIVPNDDHKYVSISGNNVEVWSSEDPEHKPQDVTTIIDYTPTISKSEGVVTSVDGNKQTLSWTINANPQCAVSMAGTTITDTIAEGSRDIMKYSGNGIHVVVRDANGNTIDEYDASDANDEHGVSWGTLGVDTTTASSWSYTIPAAHTGRAYSYLITYTTEVDMTNKLTTTPVNNTVTTDGGSVSYSGASLTQPDESGVILKKKATHVDLANQTISWRVTFNVPASGFTTAKLVDKYPVIRKPGSEWPNVVWYYEPLVPPTDENVIVTGLVDGETWSPIQAETDQTKATIGFSSDEEGYALKPTENGRAITVEFKTVINADWLADSALEGQEYLQTSHINTVDLITDKGTLNATAPATVVPNAMKKDVEEVGKRTVGGVELPVYKYEIYLHNLDSDSITITDQFDTSLLSLYEYHEEESQNDDFGSGYAAYYVFGGVSKEKGAQTTRGNAKFDYVETADGITIHTNPNCMPHDADDNLFSTNRLVYYLTVKDANALQTIKKRAAAAPGGVYRITNSASYAGQTVDCQIDYKYPGLQKVLTNESELTNPNIDPEFKLTINSEGLMLNGGQPITLTDTLTNLNVIPTTISINPENAGVTWRISGNVVTYTIPDATPVEITYSARVASSMPYANGELIQFSNTAEMLGYTKVADGQASRKSSGAGTGSIISMKILKHKAGYTNEPLAGASFKLMELKDENVQPVDGNLTPVTFEDGEHAGEPIPEFGTDAEGIAIIKGEMDKNHWSLQKNKKYYLQETEAPEGYQIDESLYEFTISAEDVTNAEQHIYPANSFIYIENYPSSTGSLQVKKVVDSTDADDENKTYKFTVTLYDADGNNVDTSINGTKGSMTFTNGVATVAITKDQEITATDLPIGAKYTVTETEGTKEGFTVRGEVKANDMGTISTNLSSVTITNKKEEKGGLKVEKAIEHPLSGDENQEFKFKVTLESNPAISGTYGEMTFTNNESEVFTLKAGDEKVASGLPVGITYSVEEILTDDQKLVFNGQTNATGEIEANKTALAHITNTRKTGGFKFNKVVTGTNVDAAQEFQFTIDVNGVSVSGTGYGTYKESATAEEQNITFATKDDGMGSTATVKIAAGGKVQVTGLPIGATYRVTETKVSGFTTTTDGAENTKGQTTSDDGTVTGYYQEGTVSDQAAEAEGVDFTFTNAHDEGGLVVQKVVRSDYAPDSTRTYTFQVKLVNASINNVASEGQPAPYGTIETTDKAIPFVSNEDGNSYATVELHANERASITGLPAGISYEVKELGVPAGMTSVITPESGQWAITANETAKVTATNTRGTGELELTKNVVSNTSADETRGYKFKVTFYTDDTYKNVATDVRGSYKVGDADPVTFSGGATANYNEDGAVTLKHGETAVFENLPLGLYYKVEEQAVDGMTSTPTTDSGQIAAATKSNFINSRIEAGLSVTKEVKNPISGDDAKTFKYFVVLYTDAERSQLATDVTGTYGTNSEDGKVKAMTFNGGVATFDLSDGQTAVASGLPVGLYYRVIETVDQKGKQSFADYTVDDLTKTDDTFIVAVDNGKVEDKVNWSEGQITQGGDADNAIKYTNTHKTGSLQLSKKLVSKESADSNATYKFRVKLFVGENAVSGTYGGRTFTAEDGVIVPVTTTDPVTIDGIPIGLRYTVTEVLTDQQREHFNVSDEVTATADNKETIAEGQNANAVEITNTRKTGGFKVKKTVAQPAAGDNEKSFAFTVTLNDSTVVGKRGDLTFNLENGESVAHFSLKHDDTVEVEDLPLGITYTVTEAKDSDFATTTNYSSADTNNEGTSVTRTVIETTNDASLPEIAFTNTRQYGFLKLKKMVQATVNGAQADGVVTDNTFTFHIAGPADYEQDVTIDTSQSDTWVSDPIPTGEYTITETGLAENAEVVGGQNTHSVTVTAGGTANDIAPVTFVNNYNSVQARLEVTKDFDAWGTAANQSFSFELMAVNDAPMPANPLNVKCVATATNEGDHKAVFDDITYTKAGTYEYEIQETNIPAANDRKGITYDETVYTAIVYVEAVATDGGTAKKLVVSDVKYQREGKWDKSLTITNTYAATGSITLHGTKELTGRQLQDGDKWNFEISSKDPKAPLPASRKVQNEGGTITFGEIKFDRSHVREHPYVYTITESGSVDGVVNDASDKTVSVSVYDNGDGTLAVTAVQPDGTPANQTDGAYFTFTNNYQVEEPIEAVKGIDGRTNNEWRRNDSGQIAEDYTFELTAFNDDDPAVTEASAAKLRSSFNLGDGKSSVEATTQGEEHKANFGTFKFTAADVGKIFKYTVREVLPKDENGQPVTTKDGVTYSTVQYDVVLTPYLEDSNTLDVRKQYMHGTTEEREIRFENSYTPAEISVKLQAKKRLQGRQITDGEFSFDLYWVNPQTGKPTLKPEQSQPAVHADGDDYDEQTKTDTATVTFDSISCNQAGTETYIIKEVIPKGFDQKEDANGNVRPYKDGVFYDASEQWVQITTEDDKMGHLTATVKYLSTGTEALPTFTNDYFGATANIEFDKVYYGNDLNATFGFTMEAAADNTFEDARAGGAVIYDPDDTTFVDDGHKALRVQVKNPTFVNGIATVQMPTITYRNPGTYYYTIAEDAPSQGSTFTPDRAKIRVKVEVDSDATTEVTYALFDGKTTSEFDTSRQTLYNNSRVSLGFRSAALRTMADATSSTSFEPAVRKVLKNGVLKGGEFQFAIYEGDSVSGDALKVVPNDANGRVSFDRIVYGPSDVRLHTYTIVELAGNDESIVYDADPIKLTVDVKLNDSGVVEATGTYQQKTDAGVYANTNDPTFVNEYDTIVIHAVKRSREEPYDPLPGAHYGLWMVNPNGEDVYMGLGRNQLEKEGSELVSSDNGDLYYDIPLLEGVAYYFREEWPPPAGHLVDPYPTDYFTLVHDKENGSFRLVYEADPEFAERCPDISLRD